MCRGRWADFRDKERVPRRAHVAATDADRKPPGGRKWHLVTKSGSCVIPMLGGNSSLAFFWEKIPFLLNQTLFVAITRVRKGIDGRERGRRAGKHPRSAHLGTGARGTGCSSRRSLACFRSFMIVVMCKGKHAYLLHESGSKSRVGISDRWRCVSPSSLPRSRLPARSCWWGCCLRSTSLRPCIAGT